MLRMCSGHEPRRKALFAYLIVMVAGVWGQMEGWRMVDRFSGFRYEVYGKVQNVGFRKAAQDKADSLGCFGWVQNTANGNIVGEARCSKAKGPLFKEWLKSGPPLARVDKAVIKDYESTKIMLHFSHFKILDDSRVTCFRDPPHQCPEFAVPHNATTAATEEEEEDDDERTTVVIEEQAVGLNVDVLSSDKGKVVPVRTEL